MISWIGDQNFFYSPECLSKVPGTKLKSKNHTWNGILGVDKYSVRHSTISILFYSLKSIINSIRQELTHMGSAVVKIIVEIKIKFKNSIVLVVLTRAHKIT